jgi:hypothetical protein
MAKLPDTFEQPPKPAPERQREAPSMESPLSIEPPTGWEKIAVPPQIERTPTEAPVFAIAPPSKPANFSAPAVTEKPERTPDGRPE